MFVAVSFGNPLLGSSIPPGCHFASCPMLGGHYRDYSSQTGTPTSASQNANKPNTFEPSQAHLRSFESTTPAVSAVKQGMIGISPTVAIVNNTELPSRKSWPVSHSLQKSKPTFTKRWLIIAIVCMVV